MTKARYEALRWFSAQSAKGRVKWFDGSAPSNRMVAALVHDGLVDKLHPQQPVGMISYAITDAGLAVLWQEQNRKAGAR